MAPVDAGDAMGVAKAVSGRLYGIGVGPGDPELITLKAARLIAALPVIAYLAPNEGESSARAIAAQHLTAGQTEIPIRVQMRPGEVPAAVYDRASEDIASHLNAGQDVGVLCEGDPFFYGSFMYLHERLAGRFRCTIVPGVASLTACAAVAGQPLVARDGVLAVLPATLGDAELERHLNEGDATAIMKVGRHLPRLRTILERTGRAASAVYVAHATRPDEHVSPLGDLTAAEAPYFSMILIPTGARR